MKNLLPMILLLLAPALVLAAKPRVWTPGTVSLIEDYPAEHGKRGAGHNYTITTASAEYVLEHEARTYFTDAPPPIVTNGQSVEISQDGSKHIILKFGPTQKRLRLVRSRKH